MKNYKKVFIALIALIITNTAQAQIFFFNDHQTIAAGGSLYGSDNGDLNGDGYLDLVVADNSAFRIVLYYGDGTGSFSSGVVYSPTPASTYNCRGVIIEDFNSDGKNDIAVACQSTSTTGVVCIFMNNGNGFDAGVNYNSTANGSPNNLAAADFDKDGKLDLVVGNGFSGQVAIYKGNGDGTFAAATEVAGTTNSSWGIDVADFNGDTYMDIVYARYYSTEQVVVMLNNQNGTFSSVSYAGSSYASDVVAKDFNKDGIPDVAAVTRDNKYPGVFLGNADGTMNTIIRSGVQKSIMDVDAHDYNMDGELDLITSPELGSGINIMKGLGTGSFGGPVTFTTISSPTSSTTGDFNNDGRPDIAAVFLHNIKILLNTINAPTLVFNDKSFTIGSSNNFMTATSNSDGAITYSIHSGDAISIDPATGEVTLNHTGTVVVKAVQAASSDNTIWNGVSYATATVSAVTSTLQGSSALVEVFYNSSENKIHINTSDEVEYTVLSNMSGQSEIHQGKEFETSMKGILVVSVVTKKQLATEKIVIY